ncbi:hypothetical protein BX600DRAFT_447802, partial [Xylariales sp. PMI_506]
MEPDARYLCSPACVDAVVSRMVTSLDSVNKVLLRLAARICCFSFVIFFLLAAVSPCLLQRPFYNGFGSPFGEPAPPDSPQACSERDLSPGDHLLAKLVPSSTHLPHLLCPGCACKEESCKKMDLMSPKNTTQVGLSGQGGLILATSFSLFRGFWSPGIHSITGQRELRKFNQGRRVMLPAIAVIRNVDLDDRSAATSV